MPVKLKPHLKYEHADNHICEKDQKDIIEEFEKVYKKYKEAEMKYKYEADHFEAQRIWYEMKAAYAELEGMENILRCIGFRVEYEA